MLKQHRAPQTLSEAIRYFEQAIGAIGQLQDSEDKRRLELDVQLAYIPALMAIAIMFLELLVAFLQAFIFTLLSAVFIGQIREAHH